MSSIFLYSSQPLYSSGLLFWKSLVELLTHHLSPLLIVPHPDCKKGVVSFLTRHFSNIELPTIFTLDELFLHSTGSFLNSKPETQLMLLHSLLDKRTCPALDPIKDTPGFSRHFFSFLDTVYQNQLSEYDLLTCSEDKDLIRDLWTLKHDFETIQIKMAPTWFTLFRQAAPQFDMLTKMIKTTPVFVFGFSDMLPYQQTLLNTILHHSLSCSILDSFSYFYTWLQDHHYSFQHAVDAAPLRHCNPSFYYTESSELEWVMQDIKSRVDEGLSLSDFALVSSDAFSPSDEHKLIQLADLYELAIDSNRPQSLDLSPVSQLVTQCCSLALNGFTRSEVKALFLCPYVTSFKHEETLIRLDLDLIQDIALNATVLERASHWISQLKSLEQILSRIEPDSPKMMAIKDHLLFFHLLDQSLLKLKQAKTTALFAKELHHIMSSFQLRDLFLNQNEHAMHSNITAYYAFQDALSCFVSDYESSFNYFQFDRCIRQLKRYLSSLYYQIPKPARQGIHLCSLNQAIFRNIPHLYILNAVEYAWSSSVKPSVFIPTGLQKQLSCFNSAHSRSFLKKLFSTATTTCQSITVSFSKDPLKPLCPSSVFQLFSRENLGQDLSFTQAPYHALHTPIDAQLFEGSLDITMPTEDHLSSENCRTLNTLRLDHSFSATELDTYNQCPKQHFYTYILKLTDQREWIDDITGSLWGTLIHDIFYTFFTHLNQQNTPYEPTQFADQDSVQTTLLFTVAEQVFQQYCQDSFYWDIKKEILFGTRSTQGLLQLFMNHESDQPLPGVPEMFEKEFKYTLNQSTPLKGKIDMVLMIGSKEVSIVDFKTGSILPSITDIKDYRSLQLPLYMLALEREGFSVGSAYFYHMKDRKRFGKKLMAVSRYAKENGLKTGRSRPFVFSPSYFDKLELYSSHLKQMMSEGKFSAEPYSELNHMTSKRSATCNYCAYSQVCRFEKRFS